MYKSTFKLVGLSRNNRLTCEPLDKQDCFHVYTNLSKEKFESLWKYCDRDWKDKKLVELSYDKLTDDGIPINPKFINILLAE